LKLLSVFLLILVHVRHVKFIPSCNGYNIFSNPRA